MSDEDDDIGEILKRIPVEEYPAHLKTATRAEYTTNMKKMQKKGCPLFVLILVLKVFAISSLMLFSVYFVYTQTLYRILVALTWFVSK